MVDEIVALQYTDLDMSLRQHVAALQHRAYAKTDAERHSSDTTMDADLHDPALNARSFMLFTDGQLVSYAGVVTTTVLVDGDRYTASGLSCVATDPAVVRRGFASQVVAAASLYIRESGVDLGVFTCAPELATLYTNAGGWLVEPQVTLVGSMDRDALTSTSLGVVVLMRLFSERARANSDSLYRATIDLCLPVGQFW